MSAEAPYEYAYRLGRIARAHGVRGEVVVQLFRRRAEVAGSEGQRWVRLRRPLPVEIEHLDERLEHRFVTHVRWLDPLRVVMRFSGLSDRARAEAMVGAYVDVDPSHLAPEVHDAIDACFDARVLDADTGALLGWVEAIRDNGAQALLEIRLEGDEEDAEPALVPVVPEIVAAIEADAEGRLVRIRPIPGLLEVNR